MSKLDDIITRHGKRDPFFRLHGTNVKRQIKDLMLELIGENNDIGGLEDSQVAAFRDELREKVGDL